MALRAGQEVDAYCTKCKLDLLHRIVAVANDKPAKVECRTCYQVHVYRAPKSAAARSGMTGSGPSGSVSTPRASAPRKSTAAEDNAPVVPPPTARVHSYRMTERYMPDQWIVHKTFGNGVVLREVAGDKIEVRFDGGLKTLVHNRTE